MLYLPSSSSILLIVKGLDVSLLLPKDQLSEQISDLGGCLVMNAVTMLSTNGLQKGVSIQFLSPTASST